VNSREIKKHSPILKKDNRKIRKRQKIRSTALKATRRDKQLGQRVKKGAVFFIQPPFLK
jgi:hypothetical protein